MAQITPISTTFTRTPAIGSASTPITPATPSLPTSGPAPALLEQEQVRHLLETARPFSFTPDEERALGLWDQLERLKVEEWIWRARNDSLNSPHPYGRNIHGLTEAELQASIEQTKRELLEAIIEYKSHRRIADAVFSRVGIDQSLELTNAHSNGAHEDDKGTSAGSRRRPRSGAGVTADPLISALYLPTLANLVHQRDALSIVHTQSLAGLADLEAAVALVRSERMERQARVRQLGISVNQEASQRTGLNAQRRIQRKEIRNMAILQGVADHLSKAQAEGGPPSSGSGSGAITASIARGRTNATTIPSAGNVTVWWTAREGEHASQAWQQSEEVKTALSTARKEVRAMREVIARLVGESGVEWVKEGLVEALLADESEESASGSESGTDSESERAT